MKLGMQGALLPRHREVGMLWQAFENRPGNFRIAMQRLLDLTNAVRESSTSPYFGTTTPYVAGVVEVVVLVVAPYAFTKSTVAALGAALAALDAVVDAQQRERIEALLADEGHRNPVCVHVDDHAAHAYLPDAQAHTAVQAISNTLAAAGAGAVENVGYEME